MTLMMSLVSFAQTTIWDGEDRELGTQGGWWADGSPAVVQNPDQSGINTSGKCMKFVMTDGNKVVKVPFREWITPNLNGCRRISLMIKKPQSENIMIELSDPTDGSEGYWQRVAAWYGGDGSWQKVVLDFSSNSINDFPGIMTITAQTSNVSSAQDVYIDNIIVEEMPKVNGNTIDSYADGSLSGHLKLTGSWMSGECQNANDEWTKVVYNDFDKLASKISGTTTSMDFRGTVLRGAYNAYGNINPNILIYADEAFDSNNVITNGHIGSLNLNEHYKFSVPEQFTAENVVLTRALNSGMNTCILPFKVKANELGAETISEVSDISKEGSKANLVLSDVEESNANKPFVCVETTASESQTFTNKIIEATPADLTDGKLIGVYEPMDGSALWTASNGTFVKVASGGTINSFNAYTKISDEIQEVSTGIKLGSISEVNNPKIYTLRGCQVTAKHLQKGVYIMNNKKVVIR